MNKGIINICSDNNSEVNPEILSYLEKINHGKTMPYGEDSETKLMEENLSNLFETKVWSFALTNGTSCNSLSLSKLCPSYGSVICHSSSHINNDEANAPALFGGGLKLVAIPDEFQTSDKSKINAKDLDDYLTNFDFNNFHAALPSCLSITQLSEFGLVYSKQELLDLSEVCAKHKLKFHMDGARFANAIVSLDTSPKSITKDINLDILSFGFTKNGAMAAEVVVIFNKELASDFIRIRKRGGQLWSKMRFVSGQVNALLNDNLWLRNATNSNHKAKELASVLYKHNIKTIMNVDGNQLFVEMTKEQAKYLRQCGLIFYDWKNQDNIYRMVTAWNTNLDEIKKINNYLDQLNEKI